jgi:hypothetical protein
MRRSEWAEQHKAQKSRGVPRGQKRKRFFLEKEAKTIATWQPR